MAKNVNKKPISEFVGHSRSSLVLVTIRSKFKSTCR